MIHRFMKNKEESDAYNPFIRKLLGMNRRAGIVKKIKKRTHHRERHEAHQQINEQLKDMLE